MEGWSLPGNFRVLIALQTKESFGSCDDPTVEVSIFLSASGNSNSFNTLNVQSVYFIDSLKYLEENGL